MMSKDFKIDKQQFWKIVFAFIAGVVVTSIFAIIIAKTTKTTDDTNLDILRNITGMFNVNQLDYYICILHLFRFQVGYYFKLPMP